MTMRMHQTPSRLIDCDTACSAVRLANDIALSAQLGKPGSTFEHASILTMAWPRGEYQAADKYVERLSGRLTDAPFSVLCPSSDGKGRDKVVSLDEYRCPTLTFVSDHHVAEWVPELDGVPWDVDAVCLVVPLQVDGHEPASNGVAGVFGARSVCEYMASNIVVWDPHSPEGQRDIGVECPVWVSSLLVSALR